MQVHVFQPITHITASRIFAKTSNTLKLHLSFFKGFFCCNMIHVCTWLFQVNQWMDSDLMLGIWYSLLRRKFINCSYCRYLPECFAAWRSSATPWRCSPWSLSPRSSPGWCCTPSAPRRWPHQSGHRSPGSPWLHTTTHQESPTVKCVSYWIIKS